MTHQTSPIGDLETLNQIAQTLNQAIDVQTLLSRSLEQLVELMGLETGWIFVDDPAAGESWEGRNFQVAAHYQLPPALDLASEHAWDKGCSCQDLCRQGRLDKAYNEILCSRLAQAEGDKQGLTVHASTPLQTGSRVLGILNIAASDWASFDERALSLLTTVGAQIGIALERARLHDLLREKRVREQAALLTFSQELLRGSSLKSLERFIVDEARRLLDVDASALLLPDRQDHRQLYFKAASGWREDPVGLQSLVPDDDRTRIGLVMSSKVPLAGQVLKDLPQMVFDQWVAEENFESVAAVPLVVDDVSIGVLAIYSRIEQDFDESELRFLQLLANQAAIALESARLQAEQLKRQQIERELEVGRQIQQSMLPKENPIIPGWQFATAMEAATAVGGDFYDFFPFAKEPQKWGIVIADVSGKGVPASLYMVLSRTTIRSAAQVDRLPAEVLRLTNQYVLEDSQADMFLSVFYATLDSETGRLIYGNAGHNYPLWWRAETGTLEEVSEHGTLVGVMNDLHLDNHEIVLSENDLLVLYTDGVTDAINSREEEFGLDRLKELLAASLGSGKALDAQDVVAIILEAVDAHKDNHYQFDDLTIFVIKRMAAHSIA